MGRGDDFAEQVIPFALLVLSLSKLAARLGEAPFDRLRASDCFQRQRLYGNRTSITALIGSGA
jgi:hypothetical protein